MAPLIELGRLAEAGAAAEEGLELARLGENPRMLLWAQSALASARLAAGDVAAALAAAGEAVELDARADVYAAGQPGWSLGAALTAAGNPDQAIPALLGGFGGEALPTVLPADRPAAAADLIEARLARGTSPRPRPSSSGPARAVRPSPGSRVPRSCWPAPAPARRWPPPPPPARPPRTRRSSAPAPGSPRAGRSRPWASAPRGSRR